MPEVDELYVMARGVLLDALEAIGDHREATILVGAQGVYLNTGDSDLGVAEYTTDADLALDPRRIAAMPPIEQALERAGFHGSSTAVGIWTTRRRTSSSLDIDFQVDLLVPASLSPGTGRRAARLPGHGATVARKVDGLEGVLVDCTERDIPSLDPDEDGRVIRAKVAGPGALLVAKMFKIHERLGSARANDKDALDVFRILQATETDDLARRLTAILEDPRSATTGTRALDLFAELFGSRAGEGAVMAARAVRPVMDEDYVRLTCATLAADLLQVLRIRHPGA